MKRVPVRVWVAVYFKAAGDLSWPAMIAIDVFVFRVLAVNILDVIVNRVMMTA